MTWGPRAPDQEDTMRSGIRLTAATFGIGAMALVACVSPASATTATSVAASVATAVRVPPAITVTAVGDMMFDSAPKRLIRATGGSTPGRAPFTSVAANLRAADVTIGNLECALSWRGRRWPGKTFTFQGDPRAIQGLTWAGFDFIAQGNNHARDYGDTALRDTFATLDRARIAHAGAGVNRAAAWKPAVITRRGARIAYLSFSQIGPSAFAATSSHPGTAYTMDSRSVNNAIRAAHKLADYVIVSFHWGIEKQYSPTTRQVRDGRAAIDAGADMVLSHHPHVIEGVELYRGRLIAYSLGNFVFSPGSMAGRDSMILHARLGPKGVTNVSVDPVYIGYNGRPVLQRGSAARRILNVARSTSIKRGTKAWFVGNQMRMAPR